MLAVFFKRFIEPSNMLAVLFKRFIEPSNMLAGVLLEPVQQLYLITEPGRELVWKVPHLLLNDGQWGEGDLTHLPRLKIYWALFTQVKAEALNKLAIQVLPCASKHI
jgi:hypothetical protein